MRYAKVTSKRAIEEGRAKRTSKGCFDYTSKSYKIENVVYNSCIGNYTVNIGFYIEAFAKYKLGLLPYDGNLGEQPNKLLEIFNIMEFRKDKKQKEYDAKQS